MHQRDPGGLRSVASVTRGAALPPPTVETERGELFDTMAQLSQMLLVEEMLETTLERIAALASTTIEQCDGVGIALVTNGRPTTVASTETFVDELECIQYRTGDGPCLSALEEEGTVFVACTAADTRWPAFAQAAARHGVRSALSLPLLAANSTVGALNVYSRTDGGLGNEVEQAAASVFAEHTAVALANAQAFEADRSLGVALQRSLLPDRLPDIASATLAARYRPAGVRARVGGDWYDAFRLQAPDGLALAVGDVVGHDAHAAVMMGQLRTGLRAYAVEGHGPGASLAHLSALFEATQEDVELCFATVCILAVDLATGNVTYANAGHPPPVLVGGDGAVRFLDTEPCPALGIAATRIDRSELLRPGDALLLYTDGLIESRRRPLGEGLASLAEAARGWTGGAEELCELVLDRLDGDAGWEDDVAVLAFEFRPKP